MTINAISSLQRSLYTGNDAALLVTPALGSSATIIAPKPLIPEDTLELGFQNDARNPGQQALARIVEILDLMRPWQDGASDQNPAHDDSVRAVSAFLDSLEAATDVFSEPLSDVGTPEIQGASDAIGLHSALYKMF